MQWSTTTGNVGVKRPWTARLYNERSISAKTAVDAALIAAKSALVAAFIAQDKMTTAAFASAEKAITKAEEAQKEYNARSNEFRGQLDDQAKQLMPRAEALGLFKSEDDKTETRFNELTKSADIMRQDISILREARSELSGKEIARSKQTWSAVRHQISDSGYSDNYLYRLCPCSLLEEIKE